MTRTTKSGLWIFVTLLATTSLSAADLVEPWDEGWSNAELHVFKEDQGDPGSCAVLGFGLRNGISLGLSFEGSRDGSSVFGALAMWSGSSDKFGDLDLWVEGAREEGEVAWALGSEWSRKVGGVLPYARLGLSEDGSRVVIEPLVGLETPWIPNIDLHVEAALVEEERARGLRIAIGPNYELAPGLELVTDLAWTDLADRPRWSATIGVVFDPRTAF